MFKLSRAAAPAAAIICLILSACGGAGAPQSAHPPGWGHPPKGAFLQIPPSQSLAGTATMYDTVTLGSVPTAPFALGGYTSGFWPTYLPLRQRYPQAHTVSIAVTSSHRANCLDVEPGDASPGEAPGWVWVEIHLGVAKPCVYSSYFEFIEEIRPLLQRAGIGRAQIFEWDADYLGCPRLDATFDATQCTNRALGRNLDESIVKLSFLSIATPPYAAPVPRPSRVAVEHRIRELRADLARHRCRTIHGKHAFRLCPRWAHEGRVAHKELRTAR
jgi:hypothetical protein